ncbi:MAG TPA: DUF3592 domain-containing protein [Acidobacteriaceae bacterium]|nr:DUF3592 domain-containing protein [Acidobacteriaceae bacterium]
MFGVTDDAPTPKEPSLNEINLKIPRHVRLSDDGRSGLWMVLIFLVGGLIWLGGFGSYLAHRWQRQATLVREGREAPAQITYISQGKGSRVHYTFFVAGASYRNSAVRTDSPHFDHFSVGSSLTVLYLPSDPSVSYPKDWQPWDLMMLTIVLLFAGAAATVIGVRGAWSLIRDHHLARHGLVTEGKVTLCVPQRGGNNYMVDYEFRTQPDYHAQNDQLIEGSNNNCPDEYKTDAKIRVIYLPHHPSRNTSWPLDSFEMVDRKPQPGLLMANR